MVTTAILAQIGIPVLVKTVSEALKHVDHPLAKGASSALGGLEEAFKRGQITPEQMEKANSHVEKMAELDASERKVALEQINESLRAEVTSDDSYVRRMRPTFGYLIAITWAAQMLALAYVIVFETSKASIVIEAMESLGTIWAVGLSVLGIYVYKRSEDKKITQKYAPMDRDSQTHETKKVRSNHVQWTLND
jgi:hypothetical protein